jgi:anaerobic ribonucleoside-triphosphate reductase
MTKEELAGFFEKNENIEWEEDPEGTMMFFRNINLIWYQNNPGNATSITYEKLDEITPEQLMNEINRGLKVEQISRVTGYFARVSGWNPGKRAELKDRRRTNLAGELPS